jgi:hypothetical protein
LFDTTHTAFAIVYLLGALAAALAATQIGVVGTRWTLRRRLA